jgi:hypothetical protein
MPLLEEEDPPELPADDPPERLLPEGPEDPDEDPPLLPDEADCRASDWPWLLIMPDTLLLTLWSLSPAC